jgi:hypothetical protein
MYTPATPEAAMRTVIDQSSREWLYDQIGFSGANVQGSVTRRHPEATGRALHLRRAGGLAGTVALHSSESLMGAYDMCLERSTSPGTRS